MGRGCREASETGLAATHTQSERPLICNRPDSGGHNTGFRCARSLKKKKKDKKKKNRRTEL